MDGYIGKAKAYLDARRGERVTLGELASAVGASPFSPAAPLQGSVRRLASRLPGRAPGRIGEGVAAEWASGRGCGVRSGVRLGVTFYEKPMLGMKARDYRARGKGQRISYCSFASPLGSVLVAATDKGLCSVKLGDDDERLERLLAEEFRAAEIVPGELKELKARILAFIEGETSLARLPLDIRGTVFQRRVGTSCGASREARPVRMQQIARAIGAPAAVRAVGSACGANPVALAVPCHRAVRTDGGMGGYAWGLQRKRKLLALEKKR
jgi:AraC family transcriptional regulator of adaptative response/methylated-DNA-[protein]-cysteine methyltransferase